GAGHRGGAGLRGLDRPAGRHRHRVLQRLFRQRPGAAMTPDQGRAAFEAAVPRAARRLAGAYWTPPAGAEWLPGPPGLRAPPAPVVDPACGGGALLWAAARRMLARGTAPAEVARRVAGVDIDPRAIAAARASLGALLGGPLPELVCADAL